MRTTLLSGVLALGISAALCGCMVERTVKDSSGHVIYQEPEFHTPFESEEKRRAEVEEKTQQLGW